MTDDTTTDDTADSRCDGAEADNDDAEAITVTVLIDNREYIHQTEGTHWARDDADRLYVYDGDTTVLEVAGEHVVEVLREDHVTTPVTVDRDAPSGARDVLAEARPTGSDTTDAEPESESETSTTATKAATTTTTSE
ncbi:hypothetical protein [Halobellus rufus]|uniref:hypothetical protein n=1 Tax=Halobellus rufus TaxID=1448860 RepID=UPI0018CE0EC2|nr:hypothetical protein [Halobellus rufus]